MPQVLSHPYCTVTSDSAKGILRFTRTELPYTSLDEMIEVHDRIGRIFDRLGRDRYVLLVDMRSAPRNSDPHFDKMAAQARRLLVHDFRRLAVLVQSALGALQVTRHLREDGLPGEVFTTEAPALEYLLRVEPEHAPSSGIALVKDGPFAHLAARRAVKK